MTLYHWTFSAEKILKSGFHRDLGLLRRHIRDDGVWFSDEILDTLDGVEEGMKLLVIEVPFKDIEEFEWIEKGKGYREWCIPADFVNQYGKPILTEVARDMEDTVTKKGQLALPLLVLNECEPLVFNLRRSKKE